MLGSIVTLISGLDSDLQLDSDILLILNIKGGKFENQTNRLSACPRDIIWGGPIVVVLFVAVNNRC